MDAVMFLCLYLDLRDVILGILELYKVVKEEEDRNRMSR